uniref:LSM12 LSM domain-containing protein n=1 Tax=Aegilops tauschii subsp. strangulata TaxID=200361 RepID=A0A453PKQ0_AEGTS
RKALQTGRSLFRIPTCSPLARASPRRICRTLKPHADTAPLRPHPGHLLPPTAAGGVMEVGGEEFAVGVVISAKTTLGEEFEGQIVSFDRPSNLLVIHILPKSPFAPRLRLHAVYFCLLLYFRVLRGCFVSMTA